MSTRAVNSIFPLPTSPAANATASVAEEKTWDRISAVSDCNGRRPRYSTASFDHRTKIDAKYRGRLLLTVDGTIVSGMVVQEDSESTTVVDGAGKKHVIAIDEIESSKPMEKSVMPDRLLAEFTAQQAADLLAFLTSQTRTDPRSDTRQRVGRHFTSRAVSSTMKTAATGRPDCS